MKRTERDTITQQDFVNGLRVLFEGIRPYAYKDTNVLITHAISANRSFYKMITKYDTLEHKYEKLWQKNYKLRCLLQDTKMKAKGK